MTAGHVNSNHNLKNSVLVFHITFFSYPLTINAGHIVECGLPINGHILI